jgi:N-acetylglucosaminyldiphosphoundecaprenol N-acetyl-beta-D-mannosaminyltransferase
MNRLSDIDPGPAGIPTESILGLPIVRGGLDEVAAELCRWAETPNSTRYFMCMNPHSFESARRLPRFAAAARAADLLVPDGIGVVMASRLRGGAVRERICGPDIFLEVSRRLSERGGASAFFLGSSADVLERVIQRYRIEYPGIDVCGSYAPPFSADFNEDQTAAMLAAINKAAPSVLWVGLGSPKQEIWVAENADRISAGFVGPIGAMFDFYAGSMPVAPRWVQRYGFQWLHRLACEPRRLWRRNLDSPLFVARCVAESLSRRSPPPGTSSRGWS